MQPRIYLPGAKSSLIKKDIVLQKRWLATIPTCLMQLDEWQWEITPWILNCHTSYIMQPRIYLVTKEVASYHIAYMSNAVRWVLMKNYLKNTHFIKVNLCIYSILCQSSDITEKEIAHIWICYVIWII